jgi:lysophospholipase L1-like esterase
MKISRRTLLAATSVAAAAVVLTTWAGPASAFDHRSTPSRWSAAWATAPQYPIPGWVGPNWSRDGFSNESIRQVVRVSAGGSGLRIRLSNRYGSTPLRIAGATIAKSGTDAAIRPGTRRSLTFARRLSTTIPPGSEATSDVTLLSTSPLESLTVTLYLAGTTGPATFHDNGLTTTYRAAGDHRFDYRGTAFTGETSTSWYYLTGVDVTGGVRPARGTVVAFGDSLTDGHGSAINANNRYSDSLAERLVAAGRPLSVVNAGINGNKLLAGSPCVAEGGIDRFGRDALDQPGARTVIVLLGLNDIGAGGFPDFGGCGASPVVSAEQVIAGHRALIRAAHAQGVRIIGATLTPMKGTDGFSTPEKEAVRVAVNDWIRTSGEYDSVVDFAQALADPTDPDALNPAYGLRPAYEFGDRVHHNDAGRAAMAAAIDLNSL